MMGVATPLIIILTWGPRVSDLGTDREQNFLSSNFSDTIEYKTDLEIVGNFKDSLKIVNLLFS